jgi:predicted nucleotidyltransferase component of viral defense system
MIDRREILDTASRVSLNPAVVEKDFALGWVLAGIYAHEELAESWLFKGGTALKKCFFETYRFSEDLDFTLLNAGHLDEAFLKRVFAEIGEWVYNESGIELPADKQDFEIFRNPRGNISCQGKLSYSGPISKKSGGLPRIKLDLTADERVVLPPRRVPIFHPYSDAPDGGIEVLAYDFVEAFAEKFRALRERTRPRDLYDVVNLYRNTEARPEPVRFLEVLRAKCEFKGIEVPRLADLELHRGELEAGWEHMLSHQLPALLPVQAFWDELPAIFQWLSSTDVVPALAAHPMSGGSTVIRERLITLPAGEISQSHIEIIRFAAANRLIVDLDYRDMNGRRSTRSIEAYSLRRSQAGHILLMAVREQDGEPRSYRLDSILGATSTQRTFTPRYPIELIPLGSQTIPPVSSTSLSRIPRIQAAHRGGGFGSRNAGPTYVFRCTVCHKEFSRKTMDGTLRPHKNKAGRECYGTHGVYVRTEY